MHKLFMVLLLLAPLSASAQESSGQPLFMKDMLDGRAFFEPWGVGADYFTMKQDYKIKSLQFDLPGVGLGDPSLIGVTNELRHFDVKLDAWITPFLNVFGLIGQVDADTYVDFSKVPVAGLPVSLGTLPVSYDGTVYGVGFNLLYGADRWFAALNNTWTDANLSGDFDSSVKTFSSQPRLGLIFGKSSIWLGAMYLDTEEKHSGTITLPIPGIPPGALQRRARKHESLELRDRRGPCVQPESPLLTRNRFRRAQSHAGELHLSLLSSDAGNAGESGIPGRTGRLDVSAVRSRQGL